MRQKEVETVECGSSRMKKKQCRVARSNGAGVGRFKLKEKQEDSRTR